MRNFKYFFKKTVVIISSIAVLSTAADWSAIVTRAATTSNKSYKEKISLKSATIEFRQANESYTYNGEAQKPKVIVSLNNKQLSAETDYDVSYTNNIKAGTATITVTGKNDYSGKATRNFTIEQAEIPENAPKTEMKVDLSVSKVSNITLPTGWKWKEDTALTTSSAIKVNAIYNKEDESNYKTTEVMVTITQLNHHHKASDSAIPYPNQEPSCTKEGKGYKICSICKETMEENVTIKPSHTKGKEYTIDKEATETEAGSKSYHCTVCGKSIEGTSVPIPAKGTGGADENGQPNGGTTSPITPGETTDCLHQKIKTVITKEATCLASGIATEVCKDCSIVLSTMTLPATGHIWENKYTIDKEATETEAGSKSYHCSFCDIIKEGSTVVIPAKGTSSSGNTGNSSTTPVPNNTPVKVPVTSSSDNKIDATVTIDSDKVTIEDIKIGDFTNNNSTVMELDFSSFIKNDRNVVVFYNQVLQKALTKVKDETNPLKTIAIKLEKVTIKMDILALQTVLNQAGGKEVQLNVENIEKFNLNEKQQSSLEKKSFHGGISISFESGKELIGDFKGGKVDLTIPFQVPIRYDENNFSIWYVASDGKMTGYKTVYKNNTLRFTVDHFSDFVILYNEKIDNTITSNKETTEETKESTLDKKFQTMRLKSNKSTKTTNNLVWGKVKDADGYVVYAAKCNTKKDTYKMKQQVVIKNKKTTTWKDTKLENGTYYKYYVKAYKLVNKKKVFIAQSKTIRVTTTGGTYGNPKAVKVNESDITLLVNERDVINAKQVKQDKKIKKYSSIRFESSDTNVATVSKTGIVKAKQKGIATIYVYAQNGIYTKVTVNVK